MAEQEPKGGGMPRSPKRRRGRGWLLRRARPAKGRSWQERKMRSIRYCPATKTRG
jgi:hypothetical protein